LLLIYKQNNNTSQRVFSISKVNAHASTSWMPIPWLAHFKLVRDCHFLMTSGCDPTTTAAAA